LTEDPSQYRSSRSKYKGRGFIQVTGVANYKAAGQGLGLDLVNHPELADSPDVEARLSGWYWQQRKGKNGQSLNALADAWDINSISYAVNTKALHPDVRSTYSDRAQSVLGAD
jgi:putative chitinase